MNDEGTLCGLLAERDDLIIELLDHIEHDPGCPAIADDESDYEHLVDAGECVCSVSNLIERAREALRK